MPSANRAIITSRSIDSIRPLKVIVIGAGISGICAAIKLPQHVRNLELVIYDKNAEIGGTWFENTYPGIACDIPSHCYQLTFESNPSWSSFYASGPEILQYWKDIVQKYDLRKYMRLHHKATEARWDEEKSKWTVQFENVKTGQQLEDTADVLIQGIGSLNQWKWPDIEGIDSFEGRLLHSANWDKSFDYKDRDVAVIGAGSSGIQITPAIQPSVKKLYHYIRGRTWLSPTFVGEEVNKRKGEGEFGGNFEYSKQEIETWKKDPETYLIYRKYLETELQSGHSVTQKDTPAQAGAREDFTKMMRSRLSKKPQIADALIPSFPPLCKRLTPGPGYLESLTQDNVTVIHNSISRITPKGIITSDGIEREVDSIICATGFDTTFQNRFPVYGIGGQNLKEKWKDRPCSYLSMAVDGFPNFFMSLGPNSAMGTGNLLLLIEHFANYIALTLAKMQRENILATQPSPRAVNDFSDFCEAYFENTVFSEECSSWYKAGNKTGRVSALWPGSSLHALQALAKPRWEDFEYTYVDGNRWGWFGDGWSQLDRLDGMDRSFYLDEQPGMLDERLDGWKGRKRHRVEHEYIDEKRQDEEESAFDLEVDMVGWW